MRHNRVYQIIEEEFDNRLGLAVIETLLDYGIDNIKERTLDEDSPIGHRIVECANRIANECSKREILQYVVEEWGSILERG